MINKSIWGKTLKFNDDEVYYPLLAHLLDSSTTAGVLWELWLRNGLKELFGPKGKQLLMLAAGLHDIGKCTPIFQGALLSPLKHNHTSAVETLKADGFSFPTIELTTQRRQELLHRHEKLGVWSLGADDELPQKAAEANWLELMILGHHGTFALQYKSGRRSQKARLDEYTEGKWAEERALLVASVERAAGVTVAEAKSFKMSPEAIVIGSGLIILADRIASSDDSVLDAHRQLLANNLNLEDSPSWIETRKDYLESLIKRQLGLASHLASPRVLAGREPRGVQRVVPENRGLWLCMAPTGAGKTEAVLMRHAQESERLTFLLPTTSTTNAMMNRVLKIYDESASTTASLGHSLAFLEDFYQHEQDGAKDYDDCGLTPTSFTKVRGARLSAAVNVATIDQLLMGAFSVKWTHLRWLLAANSHIVIDEAHLIDRYQLELLKPLLRFLGRVDTRISILSATLPSWLENQLSEAYSGVTQNEITVFPSSVSVSQNSERSVETKISVEEYEVTVALHETTDPIESHLAWTRKTLLESPKSRIGIFVNQIDRAQTIAKRLSLEHPDAIVLCLHSRMLAGHRKKVIDELLTLCGTNKGKGERIILVGTQVIEMSLDIDLDFLTTDICPAPNIIQRVGRTWRNREDSKRFSRIAENKTQSINIVIPIKENKICEKASLPYSLSLIERTVNFLNTKESLSFPNDIQNFVETVEVKNLKLSTSHEEEEVARAIFAEMKGKNAAIDSDYILDCTSPVKAFSELTEGGDEETLTRLIEWQNEIWLVQSDELWLQKLGAIVEADFSKVSKKQALEGSVSLSWAMSKALSADGELKPLELPTGSYGFFGPLPNNFVYDPLVGLLG